MSFIATACAALVVGGYLVFIYPVFESMARSATPGGLEYQDVDFAVLGTRVAQLAGIVGLLGLILTAWRPAVHQRRALLTTLGATNALFGVSALLLAVTVVQFTIIVPQALSATRERRHQERVTVLAAAQTPEARFHALTNMANEYIRRTPMRGEMQAARRVAEELLVLLPQFTSNGHYGDAVQNANLVLGLIALEQNRVTDAQRYLINAGDNPGSPQLNRFGPNMSLAQAMLEHGQRQAALDYLRQTRRFWTRDGGQSSRWTNEIARGDTPNFGPNLVY